eukprot:CAMPEP_0117575250 /NCGR_PEP_ID=MMETSP0784-20121206/62099_1 /TAXON_ID=39447 /ORGANISM="" /LENGTH=640 /DNA_ID=CAMNT_0005374293 /DNA_START=1 /DNA_END=1923 /DNA_ORIENTATION=-
MRVVAVGVAAFLRAASCAKVTARVPYLADGVLCSGFMTYNDEKCSSGNKCPAVMIVHDWNGMNEYEMARACMIADMGYVAFAADIYGVDTPVATMTDWMAASGSHASNATKYMNKIHGAFTTMLEYDFVDADRLAAVGYCFGGTGLINVAMVGHDGFPGVTFPSGLLGVVSYHGGLSQGYAAPQSGSRPKLLLHSGGKDDSNEHISKLTDDLESVSASYEISRYGPRVLHSFTEWDANVPGMAMYDARADELSWSATDHFFHELFFSGVDPQTGLSHSSASDYEQRDVSYVADGVDCLGHLVYYAGKCTSAEKCPAVIIIPDWNGMNEYEKVRASMLAEAGYVAFAADIYGVDTPVENMQHWMAASGSHRSNATKFMNKIHGAIAKVMEYDFVDTDKMAAIGYCFGGTGLINLAMVGHTGLPGISFPPGLLGVVSFHGGISSGYAAPQSGSRPLILVHSGGKDDSNDDIAKLTDDFESVGASYEITRYGSSVFHSFTEWGANAPGFSMYDARADFRSWSDTMDFFHELFLMGDQGTRKPSAEQCGMGTASMEGHSEYTCGEIKEAYRSSRCCRNPDRAFTLKSHRRMSAVADTKDTAAQLLAFLDSSLKQARAEGGVAKGRELAAKIRDIAAPYGAASGV